MFWKRVPRDLRPPSLLRSLARDLLLLQLVGLVLFFVVLLQRLDATIDDLEERTMRQDAVDLVARLAAVGLGSVDVETPAFARFSPAYGRYVFSVLESDGRVILSSARPVRPLAPLDPAAGREARRFKTQTDTTLLWGLSLPATISGQAVWIQVAEDMNHRDALADEVTAGVLKQGAWLLLGLSAVGIVLVLARLRRQIRPLVAASASAAAIGPEIGGGRIRGDGLPREVLPLVDAVNGAFDRLEIAFRAQKDFLEMAAHELRTPLSVLRARVETMEDGALRRDLETDIAGLSRLVTQILRAAEMEGLAVNDHAPIDLGDLAATVAGYLRPAAAQSGRQIRIDAEPGVMVEGCTETIGQAINNLVENALAHTPAGTPIEVRVGRRPVPHVRVRDHGPGIPPEERALVFQRFWRRDRRRNRSGAGLGLAMVRRAMELHHGSVTIEEATDGGAVFVLSFPPTAG